MPPIYAEWRSIVSDLQVRGVQVHDARLVAAMVVHDTPTILTFNKSDFARYSGITALDPAEVIGEEKNAS